MNSYLNSLCTLCPSVADLDNFDADPDLDLTIEKTGSGSDL
jgi:hypothetical protein